MKLPPLSPSNYSFNAALKTITFSGIIPARIQNIAHIANITQGVLYYQPQGGLALSGAYTSPVLTLNCSTTGHSNTDELLIIIDDGSATTPVSGPLTDSQLRAQAVPIAGTVTANTGLSQPLTDSQLRAQAVPVSGPLTDGQLRATAVPVGDNNSSLTIDTFQVFSTATFTRPSDTISYAAFDVVSNSTTAPVVITFPNCARANGGSGMIISVRHVKSSSTTLNAAFRLHLFRVAPTAINDNAAYTMLDANRASRIGYVDLVHISGGTGSNMSEAAGVFPATAMLPFICDAASSSLIGVLTTIAAYAPASGEQHYFELGITQN